ncbi:MAG: hypothetical protein FJ033_06780 [Chloroflexi bacterium]|nr:hypothetical protein [Chloroflexota bacterium]
MRQIGGGRALGEALIELSHGARIALAVDWMTVSIAVGLVIDCLMLLLVRTRVLPVLPAEALVLLPGGGAVVALVAAMVRPLPLPWLAREVDRRSGLRERAQTALETLDRDDDLARALRLDALTVLRRTQPLDAFRPRVPVRVTLVALVAAAIVVGMQALVAPPPTADTERLRQIALGEAERIEALADEVEADPLLASTGAAEMAAILRQTAEALRNQEMVPERAMARVAEAERSLTEMRSARAFDAAAALSRMADVFDREAVTRPVAHALDRRDYARAAHELAQLGSRAAQASGGERDAISEALRLAGAATARHDESLAQALRAAAERARLGDPSSTHSASQELSRVGAESRRQETLERAMSQLQSSRSTIGSGGMDSKAPSSSAAGASERVAGQPGSGGQSGSGREDADGEQAGAGAGTGIASNSMSRYDPAMTQANQVEVPGGDFDRPSFSEGGVQDPSAEEGTVTVDYRSVLPTYYERATRAMQDRYVPLGLKELVRQYFSSLQPPGVG